MYFNLLFFISTKKKKIIWITFILQRFVLVDVQNVENYIFFDKNKKVSQMHLLLRIGHTIYNYFLVSV